VSGAADTPKPKVMEEPTLELKHNKEVKTPLYCHECTGNFIALLDFRIDGNHVVECPHCGHEHCRVIENGMVTHDRWSSRFGSDKTRDATRVRRVWKSDSLPMKTTGYSNFLMERWMERLQ
jgi:hypothetical protein